MKHRKILGVLLSLSVIFTYTCAPVYAESIPDKDETVYVVSEQDGSIDKVTVSERLKTDIKGKVKDESELEDIENVKGDETFTQDGTGLVWDADGEDIYYQGSSCRDLPVEMKVKYYLNGIRRNPDKIAGKSGDVKIVISFDSEEEIPYAAVSALSLPADSFSNVTVSCGEVITNGDSLYVAGVALPGLEGITSKLESGIGGNIVIKAECTDFEVSDIYTVLTNEEVKDIDAVNSVDELGEKVEELTDASEEISDGAEELAEGAGTLDTGYKELDDGIGDISEGAESLNDGIEKMAEGSESIYTGMTSLQKNLELTYKGVQQFSELTDLLAGLDLEGLSGDVKTLYNGIGSVDAGLADMQQNVAAVQAITESESEALTGQEEIIAQLSKIKEGYEAQGIPVDDLEAVIQGLEETTAGMKKANAGEIQYEAGLYSALSEDSDMRQGLAAMQSKLGSLNISIPGDTAELTQKITDLQNALKAEAAGAKTLAGYQNELTESLEKAADGSGKLSDGTDKLVSGSSQISDGVGELAEGADALSEGINQFNEEGIGQIESVFNTAQGMLDDFNSSVEKAKAYESYGGNADGQQVKTKFIIRTKGVEKEEK